jgi:hypothetical protein
MKKTQKAYLVFKNIIVIIIAIFVPLHPWLST